MKEHILLAFIIATVGLLHIDCKSFNCEHVNVSISLLARPHVPEGVSQYSLLVSILHK